MTQPTVTRLLLIDDDEVDRTAVRRTARFVPTPLELIETADADDALTRLENGEHFDLALVDYRLSYGVTGVDVIKKLREKCPLMPMVLLTGMQDPQLVADAMRAGAFDYFPKDQLSAERFETLLRNAQRLYDAEHEAAEAQKSLARQAALLQALAELSHRLYAENSLESLLRSAGAGAEMLFGSLVRIELRIERQSYEWGVPRPSAGQSDERSAQERLVVPLPFVDSNTAEGQLILLRPLPFVRMETLVASQLARNVALAADRIVLLLDAEQRTREREDLLAIVSHDLRTPLQTLMLGVEGLGLSAGPSAPEKPVLGRLRRSIDQMSRLIDDLVDVARIQEGKLSVQRSRVDAAKIARDLAEEFRDAAAQRNVEVRTDLEPCLISVDSLRLRQVLQNLMQNALRHTQQGYVLLRVRPTGDAVIIEVEDSGEGVPDPLREHLFERLVQSDGSNRGSLGLGLYIVRGIVEAHEGTLSLRAREGGGTIFEITLPRIDG